ncbi:hypothetical protein [Sphingobium cupriresistens]|uniref:Uncharacterized protein n=1 Tax=Sphingobium cupriresistens TaxID=1132417 RepID=A0A8G2DW62_9SPHN|nr:hypothetical protein [Sphingobium cupriresistens]RYM09829.1 hypothetical protein EWH12_13530 [Sphingobium cupriresistens]
MREDAWREYEAARAGIEKYDEHLYRIRQWNIALTAASIAAILGLAQTGNFRPSMALFGYTAICFVFWLLDAMNKSLQNVHIHVSRDIERYLRRETNIYIGPAISLRFNRKTKRHLIETIKNLTDQSVLLFYVMPLAVFWGVTIFSKWENLCFRIACDFPLYRLIPLVSLLFVLFTISLSRLWKNGKRHGNPIAPLSRYFLRSHAAARCRLRASVAKRIDEAKKKDQSLFIQQDVRICPFNIDFLNLKTGRVLLIDRYPLSKNIEYIEERRRSLDRLNLQVLSFEWSPPKWHMMFYFRTHRIKRQALRNMRFFYQDENPISGYCAQSLGLSASPPIAWNGENGISTAIADQSTATKKGGACIQTPPL